MTNYIVDSTGAGDFATLTAAAKAAQPGDVFNVKAGTYRERLDANVAQVTWQAEQGVILDGGWRGGMAGTGWTPVLSVTAPGCTVSGFDVRNSFGRGILIQASDTTLAGCRTNNTFQGALQVGDGTSAAISNVSVRDCVFTKMSQSWVTEKRPQNVNGCVNIHNAVDSLFEGNVVSDGWGEGINIGRNSTRVIVRGNTIHSCNHVLIYFNRALDCVVEGNIAYHIPDPLYGGKKGDSYSAGVIVGDERGARLDRFAFSRGNVIRGNLVVNTGKLFQVRNNAIDDGYDTVLEDTVIENNTFVAGPVTTTGIEILGNRRGRSNSNSVFRNNAVVFDDAAAGADIGTFNSTGVTFSRNGWTSPPPQTMRDAADVWGDAMLDNPSAVIKRVDGVVTDFDRNNYRPLPGSPLVDAPVIGAMEPETEPEPEPEPKPEPEWDWILAEMEDQRAQLATISLAVEDAQEINRIVTGYINALRKEL